MFSWLLVLSFASVCNGIVWCNCMFSSTDLPTNVWEYNTTDCDMCKYSANASTIGCVNFTSGHAALELPSWGVSTSVACSSSLIDWTASLSVVTEIQGVSVECNATTCCCPSGSFRLSDLGATSVRLETTLTGKCPTNDTAFSAVVPLATVANTFLKIDDTNNQYPLSGRYLVRGNSGIQNVDASVDCIFFVQQGGTSSGAVAGIVIGVLLGICVLGAVGYYAMRRRRASFSQI